MGGLGPGGGGATKIKVRHAPERNDIRSILGAGGHYVVDLTDADALVEVPEEWQQCRWYEVDVGGPVRFAYKNDTGEAPFTVTLLAIEGANDQYPNITGVYPVLGDGSTPCSCQVYDDATGALVNGIRLVM
jgi:hypothetical protein